MGGNYRGNNRNQRNFRGRGHGRPGGQNNRDNNKGQWQTTDRLSEPAAGITEYISNTTSGFQGIIKSRYLVFIFKTKSY